MNKTDKIYVSGHNGMLGSAIVRHLKSQGYENILTRSSKELDLRNTEAVDDFMFTENPSYVFIAAAKVGGFAANMASPVEFLLDNLKIQNNPVYACALNKLSKVRLVGWFHGHRKNPKRGNCCLPTYS